MNARPSPAGASRMHTVRLVTIFMFCVVGVTRGQEVACTASVNKNEAPTFLCGVQIRLRRERDCSLSVVERITFPHTVNTKFRRNVYRLADIQSVSNVRVLLNNSRIRNSLFEEDDENSATIEFETEASTSNSSYSIIYSLSNGALRFSRSCDGTDGQSFPQDNVIRWRSGMFREAVDQFSVVFESAADGRLSFVALDDDFESQSESGAIRMIALNVTDEIEAYVRETGTALCAEDVVCDDGGLGAWIIFAIAAGSIAVVVCAIVVALLFRKKKSRSRVVANVDSDTP